MCQFERIVVMVREQNIFSVEYSTSNDTPLVLSFGKTQIQIVEHLPDVGPSIPTLLTDMVQYTAGAISAQLTA